MKNQWHLLDFSSPTDCPYEGQNIYLSIAEDITKPFSEPQLVQTDLDALKDLSSIYPDWIILWQYVPPPSFIPAGFQNR